ncbi:polysaccharide deacetylase [Fervidicella metallireducens AeB]|uniref:Polysaccharide deacetylase n=1 Tax=Fervidicella metallireducens AeB TaxID=1403537 RepID=A0A017RUL1_9CLOT|nr:polysaccharide deacetylase family protein [Fervidicella metallireducens]EYE87550.1 polysaccharide deacetylase [Fervidicella metallireducens AeB]
MKEISVILKNIIIRDIVHIALCLFMAQTGFISIYICKFIIPLIILIDIIYLYVSKRITQDSETYKKRLGMLCLSIFVYSSIMTGFTYNTNLKQSIPVLTYHRVNYETINTSVPTLTPEEFDKQMSYLKKHGYNTITAEDLYKYYNNKKVQLPKKSILITFDDGWKDNYENAYPILKKYNYKATIFLATGKIGTENFMTWDNIREMQDYGISFGGHTVNHVNLKKLTKDEAYTEIKNSYDDIVTNLKIQPISFCYPYGGGDLYPSIQRLVKEAGFSMAFGSHNYGINSKNTNNYAIRRILMPRYRILHKIELIFLVW